WISGSSSECFEAVTENNLRRILVACDAGNLGQLVGKRAVDTSAIELIVLETECQMIHQPSVESVISIDPQYRCTFERCSAIADDCWQGGKRRSGQRFVIKHFCNVVVGPQVFVDFFR